MGPRFRMGRRRGLLVGAAVGAAAGRASRRNSDAAQAPAQADSTQQYDELEKLGQLKDQGILTQEEFNAKKKQILGF